MSRREGSKQASEHLPNQQTKSRPACKELQLQASVGQVGPYVYATHDGDDDDGGGDADD